MTAKQYDRDVNTAKTPPRGVAEQLARPPTKERASTQPGEPIEERIDRRTKHISDVVVAVPERLAAVEDGQTALVVGHNALVASFGVLREDVARQDGKLDILITIGRASADEREKRRAHDLKKTKLTGTVQIVVGVIATIGVIVAAWLGVRG